MREMDRRGGGAHHVVHNPAQVEVVPVVHEPGAFIGRGPQVLSGPERRSDLGPARERVRGRPGGRHRRVCVPEGWTREIDVVEVLAVEQSRSGAFLFSSEGERV